MRDLVTGDRPNRECLHGCDGGGLTVEFRELDLERLAVSVHVDHRADVANCEALTGHRLGQNYSIVLLDHFEWSLLARIRGHEPRRVPAAVDDLARVLTCRLRISRR
jgi:hypothetical protein